MQNILTTRDPKININIFSTGGRWYEDTLAEPRFLGETLEEVIETLKADPFATYHHKLIPNLGTFSESQTPLAKGK